MLRLSPVFLLCLFLISTYVLAGDTNTKLQDYIGNVSYRIVNKHNKQCTNSSDCEIVLPRACVPLCGVSVMRSRTASYQTEVSGVVCDDELTVAAPRNADCAPRIPVCNSGTCMFKINLGEIPEQPERSKSNSGFTRDAG